MSSPNKLRRTISRRRRQYYLTNLVMKVIKDGESIESDIPGNYAGGRPGKIFGRLDCKSSRRMKKENRVFFLTWQDAIDAGYRPCKNCKPTPNSSE